MWFLWKTYWCEHLEKLYSLRYQKRSSVQLFPWARWYMVHIDYGNSSEHFPEAPPFCAVPCPGRGVCESSLVLSGRQGWLSPCLPQCGRSGWKGSASSHSPQEAQLETTTLQPQSAHCSEGKAPENYCNGSCWFLLISPFNLENRACSFLIFVVNLILMRKVHGWFDFNEENGLQCLKPTCSILTVLLSITYSDSDPYFRHFLIWKYDLVYG